MLEADEATKSKEKEYSLSPEQINLLKERMESYERGKMSFSLWSDVKVRIVNKK